MHFLLTFQEVMPISKTRNQLYLWVYKPPDFDLLYTPRN